MRIWFCKSNDIGGRLIRLVTFSRWNHVAVEIDGVVYDAMAGQGVRKLDARSFGKRWAATRVIDVPVAADRQAHGFLASQVGKGYDWLALFALPLRTTWQSPHRWFCSELATKALLVAGYRGFNVDIGAHRITPRDLWVSLPQPSGE